jgi:acyl-CoA thioesterase II
MNTITELIKLISLKKVNDTTFEGTSSYMGSQNVFGGQVVSQALYAAYQTVPEDRFCHSLHSYFILPGDLNIPITYEVTILRDGGSFTTRSVTARQNGEAIFMMACSFQIDQDGYCHQIAMPEVKQPEELMSWNDLLEQFGTFLPQKIHDFISVDRPLDFKPVEIPNPFDKKDLFPESNTWIKFTNDIEEELPLPILHQIIAYASDYNVLTTSLLPHASKAHMGNTQLASLDHSIWFHRKPEINDWMLINVKSPSTSNTRGLNKGNLFNRSGELVCSLTQEGLIRPIQR